MGKPLQMLGWDKTIKLCVGKTINSPLLTHKIAISLSLMRIYVLYFSDVYHCPNLKLTHKSALKSRLLKFINFSLKRFVICLFRRRYGSKWRAYGSYASLIPLANPSKVVKRPGEVIERKASAGFEHEAHHRANVSAEHYSSQQQ